MPRTGALLCLASAAAFGAMGIFGKLAYDDGATVGTLLAVRFLIAAALLWLIVVATGRARALFALPRRDAVLALALGALGYSAQAGGYFAALERMDASLLALLLYTYPAMVTIAAVALGREAVSPRTVGALLAASAGLVLVLAGAAGGALDPLRTEIGLSSSEIYTAYILVSQGVATRLGALPLATLVCTGAAITLTLFGLAGGGLQPGRLGGEGLAWIGAIAVVSTVGAIGLFFAGLARVGPSAASILSTVEPVVTVGLAFAVFGESLGPAQLVGGALVLSAALIVRAGSAPAREPAPVAAVRPEPAAQNAGA
jgi:drug/metabolite transporter (DMT)-like permease